LGKGLTFPGLQAICFSLYALASICALRADS
jgi:hypothetical protein